MSYPTLALCPVTFAEAKAFVQRHHPTSDVRIGEALDEPRVRWQRSRKRCEILTLCDHR